MFGKKNKEDMIKKIFCITPKVLGSEHHYVKIELDYDWIDYLKKINYQLIVLNETNLSLLKKIKPQCIIISGGGDIYDISKKKTDLKRDKFELKVFKLFNKKIPIICVCRGFQLIATKNFKAKIFKTINHVNTHHDIYGPTYNINVNSFHNYAIKNLPKVFNKIFYHKDKSIELAISKKNKIMMTMFHPERFNKDQIRINKLLKSFLK